LCAQPATRRAIVAPPALSIALEGWFSFIEGASVEWLERGGVDRDQLRTLLLSALGGALGAARAADPSLQIDSTFIEFQ
jgi:hypothetical protein